MPIYPYKCEACNKEQEILHGYNDKPTSDCCKNPKLIKLPPNRFGISLKGSGWTTKPSSGWTNTPPGFEGSDFEDKVNS